MPCKIKKVVFMGIPKKRKSLPPPEGGLPPEFTIAGKVYFIQSVNVITDEVVIIERATMKRHSFDFYVLREKIKTLA